MDTQPLTIYAAFPSLRLSVIGKIHFVLMSYLITKMLSCTLKINKHGDLLNIVSTKGSIGVTEYILINHL